MSRVILPFLLSFACKRQDRTVELRRLTNVRDGLLILGAVSLAILGYDMLCLPLNSLRSRYKKPATPLGIAGSLMATLNGLEPSTSCVTGRRSNQLSYSATRSISFVVDPFLDDVEVLASLECTALPARRRVHRMTIELGRAEPQGFGYALDYRILDERIGQSGEILVTR